MLNIEKVKLEIIERLKPLNPNKIILFGSYAYGKPNKESDIDLFLLKDELFVNDIKTYSREARKRIRDLIYKYQVGFDILSASTKSIMDKEDYFYKVDILQRGEVIYEQNNSQRVA
jgi:predicted nucleotidyltransferase